MYIGLIMLGASIGGNGQFGPVLASQVFGRKDFSVSYSCMNMISGVVRSCSYAVLAILHAMVILHRIQFLVLLQQWVV